MLPPNPDRVFVHQAPDKLPRHVLREQVMTKHKVSGSDPVWGVRRLLDNAWRREWRVGAWQTLQCQGIGDRFHWMVIFQGCLIFIVQLFHKKVPSFFVKIPEKSLMCRFLLVYFQQTNIINSHFLGVEGESPDFLGSILCSP